MRVRVVGRRTAPVEMPSLRSVQVGRGSEACGQLSCRFERSVLAEVACHLPARVGPPKGAGLYPTKADGLIPLPVSGVYGERAESSRVPGAEGCHRKGEAQARQNRSGRGRNGATDFFHIQAYRGDIRASQADSACGAACQGGRRNRRRRGPRGGQPGPVIRERTVRTFRVKKQVSPARAIRRAARNVAGTER